MILNMTPPDWWPRYRSGSDMRPCSAMAMAEDLLDDLIDREEHDRDWIATCYRCVMFCVQQWKSYPEVEIENDKRAALFMLYTLQEYERQASIVTGSD